MIETREYLRIGPLADRYGVSAESIRIWERQGRIPPAMRTPGGHRRYGAEHVAALEALLGVRPLCCRDYDPTGLDPYKRG